MACLESLSTTIRMAVKPVDEGSCSMNSMEMEFQGFSGMGSCQVRVYSSRGSGQVRTKADEGEGQGAGQGISPAGVETDWIQRQGGQALIPCIGSGQGDGVGDRQRLE